VRKGFENAVAHYLQTGIALDIAVMPADDELDDMGCEVAQINADCGDGVPEGKPWTFRVPTSINVLDADSGGGLPVIELKRCSAGARRASRATTVLSHAPLAAPGSMAPPDAGAASFA